MSNRHSSPDKKITKDLKELVIARLDVLPQDKKISLGSSGEFTKTELIQHVEKEDEIGQKIVEIELAFLQALKRGMLLEEALVSNEK